MSKGRTEREQALDKAVDYYSKEFNNKEEAIDKIIWKLNAIRTLTKNTEPQNHRKLSSDINYLQTVKFAHLVNTGVVKTYNLRLR